VILITLGCNVNCEYSCNPRRDSLKSFF
jgi:pyruvate-formate lyase-activating enzyme